MPEFTLVEDPNSLASVLTGRPRLGMDTEFVREKTFFAELCLLQLATGECLYCVDPLTGADMADFWDGFLGTPWVLHSGRQDVEVVYQTAGRMPRAIFDTQIAAGLLGHPPQMGYASLVKALFGVDIEKSHTRADWSQRPLPAAYLEYAAEDVEYLLPAFTELAGALEDKGRLAWAEEDSAQLLDPALYDIDPATAVDRLKAARNLRGKHRAAAARLAAWRENEALRVNRPRQWIAKDTALMELASRLPVNIGELARIDGLPGGFVRRTGNTITQLIADAIADDSDYSPPPAPDDVQRGLLKNMQKRVARRAEELGIAAETVASRKDLSALISSPEAPSRLLDGWRRGVIGEELLKLL
ncbi:MAG: HRDC domain-containing protein [Woeseiaceae bacterium]